MDESKPIGMNIEHKGVSLQINAIKEGMYFFEPEATYFDKANTALVHRPEIDSLILNSSSQHWFNMPEINARGSFTYYPINQMYVSSFYRSELIPLDPAVPEVNLALNFVSQVRKPVYPTTHLPNYSARYEFAISPVPFSGASNDAPFVQISGDVWCHTKFTEEPYATFLFPIYAYGSKSPSQFEIKVSGDGELVYMGEHFPNKEPHLQYLKWSDFATTQFAQDRDQRLQWLGFIGNNIVEEIVYKGVAINKTREMIINLMVNDSFILETARLNQMNPFPNDIDRLINFIKNIIKCFPAGNPVMAKHVKHRKVTQF